MPELSVDFFIKSDHINLLNFWKWLRILAENFRDFQNHTKTQVLCQIFNFIYSENLAHAIRRPYRVIWKGPKLWIRRWYTWSSDFCPRKNHMPICVALYMLLSTSNPILYLCLALLVIFLVSQVSRLLIHQAQAYRIFIFIAFDVLLLIMQTIPTLHPTYYVSIPFRQYWTEGQSRQYIRTSELPAPCNSYRSKKMFTVEMSYTNREASDSNKISTKRDSTALQLMALLTQGLCHYIEFISMNQFQ